MTTVGAFVCRLALAVSVWTGVEMTKIDDRLLSRLRLPLRPLPMDILEALALALLAVGEPHVRRSVRRPVPVLAYRSASSGILPPAPLLARRKEPEARPVASKYSPEVDVLLNQLQEVVSAARMDEHRRDQLIVALYATNELSLRAIAPHTDVSYSKVRDIVLTTVPLDPTAVGLDPVMRAEVEARRNLGITAMQAIEESGLPQAPGTIYRHRMFLDLSYRYLRGEPVFQEQLEELIVDVHRADGWYRDFLARRPDDPEQRTVVDKYYSQRSETMHFLERWRQALGRPQTEMDWEGASREEVIRHIQSLYQHLPPAPVTRAELEQLLDDLENFNVSANQDIPHVEPRFALARNVVNGALRDRFALDPRDCAEVYRAVVLGMEAQKAAKQGQDPFADRRFRWTDTMGRLVVEIA